MAYMSAGVRSKTDLGEGGVFGSVMRVLSGETFFINSYVNASNDIVRGGAERTARTALLPPPLRGGAHNGPFHVVCAYGAICPLGTRR